MGWFLLMKKLMPKFGHYCYNGLHYVNRLRNKTASSITSGGCRGPVFETLMVPTHTRF
jgi:hypothetical protein